MLKTKRSGKSALALLLCCLVLFISLLCASPSLHRNFHPDADAPDHVCAVTLFVKGSVTAMTLAPVFVAGIVFFGGVNLLPEISTPPSSHFHFSRSRAPPVCC